MVACSCMSRHALLLPVLVAACRDGAAAWAAQDLEYDAVGALNLHDDEDDYDTAGGAGSSKQHSGAGLAPAGEAAALGGAAAAAAAAAGHGR